MNTQSCLIKALNIITGVIFLLVAASNSAAAEILWQTDDKLIEIVAQPQYNDQKTINTLTLNITDKTLGGYQYTPLTYTLVAPYKDQQQSVDAEPKKSTLNGDIKIRMLTQSTQDLFIVVDLYYGDAAPTLQHHVTGSTIKVPIQEN